MEREEVRILQPQGTLRLGRVEVSGGMGRRRSRGGPGWGGSGVEVGDGEEDQE